MKAIRAAHKSYELSALDETEFALAISPCPQIEKPNDPAANTERAGERSEPERSQALFREDDLTDTLTIGWGIALAIAVAIVVYTSGG